MGDAAVSGQTGQAVMIDSLGRAYALNIGATLRHAMPRPKLVGALAGQGRDVDLTVGPAAMSLTLAPGGGQAMIERTLLAPGGMQRTRALSGRVGARLGARTTAAFGFAQSGAALSRWAGGEGGDPFLVAPDPLTTPGFEHRAATAMALRRSLGAIDLVATVEQGDALVARSDPRRNWQRSGYGAVGLSGVMQRGPFSFSLGVTRMIEAETVLGARFGSAFGDGGAASWFGDARAAFRSRRRMEPDRRDASRMDAHGGGGAALDGGRLASAGWTLGVAKRAALMRDDQIAFRLSQPLRVSHGGYALTLPTGYDYPLGVTQYAVRSLSLAPQGRELDAEAAWSAPLGAGWLTANLYWRRDPGNIASLRDDRGAALRYRLGF